MPALTSISGLGEKAAQSITDAVNCGEVSCMEDLKAKPLVGEKMLDELERLLHEQIKHKGLWLTEEAVNDYQEQAKRISGDNAQDIGARRKPLFAVFVLQNREKAGRIKMNWGNGTWIRPDHLKLIRYMLQNLA